MELEKLKEKIKEIEEKHSIILAFEEKLELLRKLLDIIEKYSKEVFGVKFSVVLGIEGLLEKGSKEDMKVLLELLVRKRLELKAWDEHDGLVFVEKIKDRSEEVIIIYEIPPYDKKLIIKIIRKKKIKEKFEADIS